MTQLLIVAALLTGCSGVDAPTPPDGMRCVRAHDIYDDEGESTGNGRVVTVCDRYEPKEIEP